VSSSYQWNQGTVNRYLLMDDGVYCIYRVTVADFRIDSVKNLYGVDGRGCISDEMPGCPVEADGGCRSIRTNINYLTASLRHSTSVRAVSDADCFAATLRKSDQSPFCPWTLLGHMRYWAYSCVLTALLQRYRLSVTNRLVFGVIKRLAKLSTLLF